MQDQKFRAVRSATFKLPHELDEAVTCIALAEGKARSQVVQKILLEDKMVQRQIEAFRAEPKNGVLAISRRMIRIINEKAKDETPPSRTTDARS